MRLGEVGPGSSRRAAKRSARMSVWSTCRRPSTTAGRSSGYSDDLSWFVPEGPAGQREAEIDHVGDPEPVPVGHRPSSMARDPRPIDGRTTARCTPPKPARSPGPATSLTRDAFGFTNGPDPDPQPRSTRRWPRPRSHQTTLAAVRPPLVTDGTTRTAQDDHHIRGRSRSRPRTSSDPRPASPRCVMGQSPRCTEIFDMAQCIVSFDSMSRIFYTGRPRGRLGWNAVRVVRWSARQGLGLGVNGKGSGFGLPTAGVDGVCRSPPPMVAQRRLTGAERWLCSGGGFDEELHGVDRGHLGLNRTTS